MSKKNLYITILLSTLILAGLVCLYCFFFRKLVAEAYNDTSPAWFNSFIGALYPRFLVEKHRFDLSFFLHKGDQIVVRAVFIAFLSGIFFYCKNVYPDFRRSIESFWDTSISVRTTSVLRILYFALLLLVLREIYPDMMQLSKARIFYRPLFIYKLAGIGFPSDTAILIIYLLLVGSATAAIINFFPVTASVITITCFIYIQGIIFGFEKTDHGFVPFTYAGMLFPFLLYSQQLAIKNHRDRQEGWPLQLILLLLCLCYLFSGLEKIFTSGTGWIHPDTFRSYLYMHETAPGLLVAKSDLLCTLLPLSTLLFQIGFILCLFLPVLRFVFLPVGILFHLGSWFLLAVGGLLNPWMLSYIFFIDWEGLLRRSGLFRK